MIPGLSKKMEYLCEVKENSLLSMKNFLKLKNKKDIIINVEEKIKEFYHEFEEKLKIECILKYSCIKYFKKVLKIIK